MLAQVCREDTIDQYLPKYILVLLVHVLQDVVLLLLDDLESQRAVVVLKDALVVIDQGLAGSYRHHEGVVESWMTNVVDGCTDQEGDLFQLIESKATSLNIIRMPQLRKKAHELVTSRACILLW
jgi:hypothetical protein